MARMVALWVVVAGLVSAGLMWRLDIIKAMVGADRPATPRPDGGELYQRLLDLGLIAKDGNALVLPPEDLELRQAQNAGGRVAPDARRHKALTELYDPRDTQGKAVRAAVASWTATRAIAAIRDDRRGPPDPDQGPILPGDRPNAWDGADTRGRPLSAADIPVPESFGYVNGGQVHPGYGDWKVFPGGADAIQMSTSLALDQAATVSLQVIGRLDAAGSTLPATAVIHWRCATGTCTAATATAATVVLPELPAGTTRLSIRLTPVPALALPVPALPLAFGADQLRRCRAEGATVCAGLFPRWTPLPRAARKHTGTMTISTSDGVTLWRDNRPTPDAVRLGLLPVIGIDPRSWSLVGRMARRRDGGDQDVTMRLTIDSKVQEAAQAALESTIRERFDGRDDDAPYRDRRRGALTVISPGGAVLAAAQWPRVEPGLSSYDLGALAAGDRTRDPLAAVGWGAPSTDFTPGSAWKIVIDLAALKVAENNPAVDAMIRGCKPNADGGLACAGLGIDQQRYSIPGQACGKHGCGIQNFRSQSRGIETLREALDTPLRSPRCVGGATVRPTAIGMAEALSISSNIWQVRLAELIDAPPARAYDAQAKRRNRRNPDLPELGGSAVIETATRLGLFGGTTDLLAPLSGTLGPAGARNGLTLAPARADLFDLTDPATRDSRPSGALDALAQISIGQRVAVAPMHLARLAAGVRNGAAPVPYLAEAWNDRAVAAPAGHALGIADLSPLRDGMKAVVETGTAVDAFGGPDSGPTVRHDGSSERLKTARCHVYGKTGSGQLPEREDGRSLNAGWFVGWAEAEAFRALADDPAAGWRQPVAFACVISPVHGLVRRDNGRVEWTKTGGTTCAPAVADFMQRLAASGNR